MKELLKKIVHGISLALVLPFLISFKLRARLMGRDRALTGSSQLFSLIPGMAGQYLRRAFYSCILAECHRTAVIGFGVQFSKTGAQVCENAYIGPFSQIGLARIERNVMLAPAVHIPSGPRVHGIEDIHVPMRDQPGVVSLITIGEASWIGSGTVVLADVGKDTIIGAGSVVTKPIPDLVIAGGIPARVIRHRAGNESKSDEN